MKKVYGNVVLVTGASSGIGKSTAELLMSHGFKVYGTSRKPQSEKNMQKAEAGDGFLKMLQMDVCSEDSIKAAIGKIILEEGRIDIVVNNAGMGIAGAAEETSAEEAYLQLDTNFFGMHRVCRHIISIMREQGRGLIINISSVAAHFPIPFQAMYSASKSAAEALSEAMRTEVAPFGVRVAIVAPGDIKTGFTGSRVIAAGSNGESVYCSRFKKSLGVMERDEMNGPDPIVIARAVWKLTGRKNPPVRTVVGFQYKLFVFLKRFLPSRFAAFVIARMY